jgi:hypothetical protein
VIATISGTPAALAAKAATTTIPIVFANRARLDWLGRTPLHAAGLDPSGLASPAEGQPCRTAGARFTAARVLGRGRRSGAAPGGWSKMSDEPLAREREPIERTRARLEALVRANAAPRCGARSKRTGKPCRAEAMPNGRCKVHGGKSTGPRTPEGLERSRRANWKHGYYSREAKAERSRVRAAMLALRYLRMSGH